MNKKEIEKERAKIKAENPLLTDEQINDILAASEAEADGGGTEKAEDSLKTPDTLAKDAGTGESVLYECKMSCTFDGRYYRAGDTLTTDKKVPEDFFTAIIK